MRSYFAALPTDRFPTVVAMADALTAGEGDERFEFGIDLLVSGLAAMAARSRLARADGPRRSSGEPVGGACDHRSRGTDRNRSRNSTAAGTVETRRMTSEYAPEQPDDLSDLPLVVDDAEPDAER